MPEFFLELFSEEIPARMQATGAVELGDICAKAFAPLNYDEQQIYYGPRRIAVKSSLAAVVPARKFSERGPRISAPEQALAGFLRKHDASREDLVQEGDFWVLNRTSGEISARDMIVEALPKVLSQLKWPKSMRWGQGGDFTWVRPLRRMVCLLDGEIVPITIGPITASNETDGHRIHGPGPVAVFSAAIWEEKLREHYVVVDQDERRRKIADGIAEKAAALGLTVAPDEGLLDEVTGLVEFPVPLIGKIDQQFMDLPPEVRELSMKVNQKYFALRDAEGKPAPYFAFVSNLVAEDDGAAIIAGNERVLRARLSDARYFWDTDLKTPLESLLPKLESVTFHTKLGSQRRRVERIKRSAFMIGTQTHADYELSQRAAKLSKCDLVTGMVGEFPELQGVIGGYYALQNGEPAEVADAVRMQYSPRGPSDQVPKTPVAITLALADKLDQIVAFFDIGERPTGSGDPYALRRAALGIIRIILENELDIDLNLPIHDALETVRSTIAVNVADLKLKSDVYQFIIDRFMVKLRGEGSRYDVLNAVVANNQSGLILRLSKCAQALTSFLSTDYGNSVITSYKRAANILRIEEAKTADSYAGLPNSMLFQEPEEANLLKALEGLRVNQIIIGSPEHGIVSVERFGEALRALEVVRNPVDAFFERVTVNDPMPEIRLNRLRLLALLRDTMHRIADFSKIEG